MANGSIRLDADFSPVTREINKTIDHFNGLDKGLATASNSVNNLIDDFKKAGSSMTTMDNKSVALAGALGKIDTSAKNPRKSLSELKKILEETTVSYNKLTDQEKASPFGKQLKSSIEQLTDRAKALKKDLGEVSRSLSDTDSRAKSSSSSLQDLAGKFGFNVKAIVGWGTALTAAKGALEVVKDAMWQSEGAIDEWGRTMEGAKGAYSSFLDTLNGGNWSNFLDNLANAIDGSRDLYDAMDRLGSIRNNNAAAIAIEEKALADARLKLQEAKNSGDQKQIQALQNEIRLHEQRLANLRKQESDAAKDAGRKQVANEIYNAATATEGASISRATAGYVADKVIQGGQPAIDAYARSYERLKKAATEAYTEIDEWGTKHTGTRLNLNRLTQDQRNQYAVAKAVVERESGYREGINTYAQGVQGETNTSRERYRYNRQAGVGSGSGSSGKGSSTTKAELTGPLIDLENKLKELQTLQHQAASPEVWKEYESQIIDIQGQIDRFKGKTEELKPIQPVTTESLSQLQIMEDQLATIKASMENAANPEDWKEMADEAERMAKAIAKFKGQTEPPQLSRHEREVADKRKQYNEGGTVAIVGDLNAGFSSVVSGLETLGVNIGEDINKVVSGISVICQIITTIEAIITSIEAITAMDAIIPFAHGGVVSAASGRVFGGHQYTDQITARVSSGEMVINEADQKRLYDNIHTGNLGGGGSAQPHVTGEMIYLGMNNFLKRTGKGEIVTSRR